jgi:hypothetical protein
MRDVADHRAHGLAAGERWCPGVPCPGGPQGLQFPEPVGRYALSMDILVADEASFVDLRQRFIDVLKATEEIAQEIKDLYGQFF